MPQERPYNEIYSELVQGPDDIVGLFAYAMYKTEKIEYIRTFKKDHSEQSPADSDLIIFHTLSAQRIASYRTLAEGQMSKTMDAIVSEKLDQFRAALKEESIKRRSFWWSGVWQSVIGSVFFTFLIGCIVVTILGLRYGMSGIVQEGIKMLTGS